MSKNTYLRMSILYPALVTFLHQTLSQGIIDLNLGLAGNMIIYSIDCSQEALLKSPCGEGDAKNRPGERGVVDAAVRCARYH
jgi:hypothetical protein